jgi:hypothetical protein
MSELKGRKDAREVWVSRSHLHAAAAGATLLSVAFFGLGFLAGRHQAFTAVEAAREERTLVGHVPGRDLLALLAEVERSSVTSASSTVVYPELLRGDAPAPALPAAPDQDGVEVQVPPPPVLAAFEGDPRPSAPFTIQVGQYVAQSEAAAMRAHLKALGLDAWWSLERVGGETRYTVAVGAFPAAESAAAALPVISDAARTAPVAGAAPQVAALSRAAIAAPVGVAPAPLVVPVPVSAPVPVAAPVAAPDAVAPAVEAAPAE